MCSYFSSTQSGSRGVQRRPHLPERPRGAGRASQAFPQRRKILVERAHALIRGMFQDLALPLTGERAVLIEQAHAERDERGRRKKEDHPEQNQVVAWRPQPCAQPRHIMGSFSSISPRLNSGCVGDPSRLRQEALNQAPSRFSRDTQDMTFARTLAVLAAMAAPAAAQNDWKLVWSDEFNSPARPAPDPTDRKTTRLSPDLDRTCARTLAVRAPVPAPAAAQNDWKLVWSDEFNSPARSAPDS